MQIDDYECENKLAILASTFIKNPKKFGTMLEDGNFKEERKMKNKIKLHIEIDENDEIAINEIDVKGINNILMLSDFLTQIQSQLNTKVSENLNFIFGSIEKTSESEDVPEEFLALNQITQRLYKGKEQ